MFALHGGPVTAETKADEIQRLLLQKVRGHIDDATYRTRIAAVQTVPVDRESGGAENSAAMNSAETGAGVDTMRTEGSEASKSSAAEGASLDEVVAAIEGAGAATVAKQGRTRARAKRKADSASVVENSDAESMIGSVAETEFSMTRALGSAGLSPADGNPEVVQTRVKHVAFAEATTGVAGQATASRAAASSGTPEPPPAESGWSQVGRRGKATKICRGPTPAESIDGSCDGSWSEC